MPATGYTLFSTEAFNAFQCTCCVAPYRVSILTDLPPRSPTLSDSQLLMITPRLLTHSNTVGRRANCIGPNSTSFMHFCRSPKIETTVAGSQLPYSFIDFQVIRLMRSRYLWCAVSEVKVLLLSTVSPRYRDDTCRFADFYFSYRRIIISD